MTQIGRIYLLAVLVFLYTPIVVMMAMGFNASPLYELPFTFSFRWYEALLGNKQLLTAGMNSIIIAVITSVLATASAPWLPSRLSAGHSAARACCSCCCCRRSPFPG